MVARDPVTVVATLDLPHMASEYFLGGRLYSEVYIVEARPVAQPSSQPRYFAPVPRVVIVDDMHFSQGKLHPRFNWVGLLVGLVLGLGTVAVAVWMFLRRRTRQRKAAAAAKAQVHGGEQYKPLLGQDGTS
jgi:hypothetical protein